MAYSRPKVEMGKEARRISRGGDKKSPCVVVDSSADETPPQANQNSSSTSSTSASAHADASQPNKRDDPEKSLPEADRDPFSPAIAAELNEMLGSNDPGDQINQQRSQGKTLKLLQHHQNVSRVSSIDWIRERASDATEDVPYDDVFRDEMPSMEAIPFSPDMDHCVPDDIYEYLTYLRAHQACLLPVEPNEDFLNKKKRGGKTLIPSEEWFREYESQKIHVFRALQNDIEVPMETCADTSSCMTDETSVQSSDPPDVKPSKGQSAKLDRCVPTDDDVLLGRGGLTNHHPGNKRYRKEADRLKPIYVRSTKREKYDVSESLVASVLSSGGRFLTPDGSGGWCEASKEKARKKASQALREHHRRKIRSDEVSN
uniref:DUF6824 domain-containing protein n=1 Tax=Helicotheca tamesis TaxID=374047 RepID=A0A7S2HBM2_9STRA|mmetsp:Transcript_16852/g.23086  ORF Transcript_16852/g.23086 Transcript_16852/m.23086 type:complete len:372 (+) Transcript_16852:140-1255(+)